jgi:hypothetical protein
MAEGDAQRRRRQQRELVHGSGAPAGLVHVLAPPKKPPKRRKWKDMGRAERFAMVFLFTVEVASFAAMAYFTWRIGGIFGVVFLAAFATVTAWITVRTRRRLRAQWARESPDAQP